jgi:anti-anti-sigma factor
MQPEQTRSVEISSNGTTMVATILSAQMRDESQVRAIKDQLLEGVNQQTPLKVVLDLTNVEFIGSIGFLAFLALRRIPKVERIVLCGLSDNVRGLFALCRLIPNSHSDSAPFEVAPTVEQALNQNR